VIDAVTAMVRAPAGASWETLHELEPWYLGWKGVMQRLPTAEGFETYGSVVQLKSAGKAVG